MLARPDTLDAPDTRRWRLMARLALEIGSRKVGWVDLGDLATKAAELITEEIGDRTLIVLDLPGHEQRLITVAAHRDPETYWQTQELVDDLGETGLREWLHVVADRIERTHDTVLDPASQAASESPAVRRLRNHRLQTRMVDVTYAPLRGPSGEVRGLVVCSRDPGAPTYDEFDHAALASAGDTISLELDLALARSEKRLLSQQRQVLLKELVRAEQVERERIAQDVHDDSIQLLSAAQLRLQLLLASLDPESVTFAKADTVSGLLHSAQDSLRALLTDLNGGHQSGLPLAEVLRRTAEDFFDGTSTEVRVTGSIDEIPHECAAVLLRVVREAISNARQHAHATSVHVSLQTTPTQWTLQVLDDGVGIPDTIPTRPGHLGLRGMSGRVAALGGRCSVVRGLSGGTQVSIEVPRPEAG